MEKGYININETEINDIMSHLEKNKTNLNSLEDSSKSKFKSLTNVNLFGNGIKKINKQVLSVSNVIHRINETIKSKTREIIELDEKLSIEANSITVPLDFHTNNTVKSHTFSGISLNKDDGKKVKDDNSLYENKIQFASNIVEQILKKITKEEVKNNTNLNDNNVRKLNMRNINNLNGRETNELQYNRDKITTKNLNEVSNISTMIKDTISDEATSLQEKYFYDDFYDEKDN